MSHRHRNPEPSVSAALLAAVVGAVVVTGSSFSARDAAAAEPPSGPTEPPPPGDDDPDRYAVRVSSETHLRLFRQAFLPGPGGAVQGTIWSAPIHEYAGLRVDDVDAPWTADSIDIELAAWGLVSAAEIGDERRVDGDLSIALVRHRLGVAEITLGRQLRAGGAARMTRFDGAAVGVHAPFGLGAEAYGGLAVLPRWADRPGYLLLGSAADSLLRDPSALEQPAREGAWLVGGRLSYQAGSLVEIGASVHEQRVAGELDRRDVGLELRAAPWKPVAVSGQLLLDTDAWAPSDARAAIDLFPLDELAITAEYVHAVPALLLSHQSVLSVFSTDAFHEVGGSVRARAADWLELAAAGYAELFAADGSAGMRLRASTRLLPLVSELLVLHAAYGRTSEPQNGYHDTRVALGVRPMEPLELTADTSLYLYDEPVRHVWPGRVAPQTPLSWVTSTTGQWSFTEWIAALLGGSVGVTPYAAFDAQLFARVRIDASWGKP